MSVCFVLMDLVLREDMVKSSSYKRAPGPFNLKWSTIQYTLGAMQNTAMQKEMKVSAQI